MEYPAIQKYQSNTYQDQKILAAQNGDLEAFNVLVLIYQEAVYNLAYRILGETESAEDITQTAFLTAFRNMPRFRNGSFRSWLFRIATNACYDELRRLKRHPLLSIEASDESDERLFLPDNLSRSEDSPEKLCIQKETEQSIQHALNELDPDQRAVVVLVDLQALDYQEAAQVLQIPVGTVKSRLARGRARLRPLLNRLDSE